MRTAGRRRHRRRRSRATRLGLTLGTLAAVALATSLLAFSGAPGSSPQSAASAAPWAGAPPTPPLPAGAITVSPAPGSRTADPATQISFLGRPASKLGTITVVGSKSGPHAGALKAYSTGDGASFLPDKPFLVGERVTVHTTLPIAGATKGTFSFTVAHVVPLGAGPHPPALRTDVPGVDHFASAPSIEPPTVTVDVRASARPHGSILLAPKGTTGQAGPMIVRPDGQLVWFKPLPDKQEAFDLNEQRLHGKPVLTWFQGEVVAGHGQGEAVIANDHYQTIAVVQGGNDTKIDLHDLELTNRGTVFVTAYRTMRWDLSSDGGAKVGTVFDGVIQEIDVKTGLVEEEWNSLDHVPVAASDFKAPKSPAAPFDYFHINGVQALRNGNLLISSRNTSAAYLVDPAAGGAVLWTLGGKHSSFSMGHGAVFWYEHDVRLRAGNVVTIFDNGSAPAREPASRALFLHLSLRTHKATVEHALVYPRSTVLAYALGNVEPLKDGKVFVGWGTAPNYSLFGSTGQLLYDATLPNGDDSYRAFLRQWTGRPRSSPSLAVSGPASTATLAMSWNGATGIARWAVRTGTSAKRLHRVATVADAGFQTTARPSGLGPYVQVEALDAGGKVLGRSSVETS